MNMLKLILPRLLFKRTKYDTSSVFGLRFLYPSRSLNFLVTFCFFIGCFKSYHWIYLKISTHGKKWSFDANILTFQFFIASGSRVIILIQFESVWLAHISEIYITAAILSRTHFSGDVKKQLMNKKIFMPLMKVRRFLWTKLFWD